MTLFIKTHLDIPFLTYRVIQFRFSVNMTVSFDIAMLYQYKNHMYTIMYRDNHSALYTKYTLLYGHYNASKLS